MIPTKEELGKFFRAVLNISVEPDTYEIDVPGPNGDWTKTVDKVDGRQIEDLKYWALELLIELEEK